jgi:hypothetical protein
MRLDSYRALFHVVSSAVWDAVSDLWRTAGNKTLFRHTQIESSYSTYAIRLVYGVVSFLRS